MAGSVRALKAGVRSSQERLVGDAGRLPAEERADLLAVGPVVATEHGPDGLPVLAERRGGLAVQLRRRRTRGSGRSRAARCRPRSAAWAARSSSAPARSRRRCRNRRRGGRPCRRGRGVGLGEGRSRRPRWPRPLRPGRRGRSAPGGGGPAGRARGRLRGIGGFRPEAVLGWHAAALLDGPGRPGGATVPQPSRRRQGGATLEVERGQVGHPAAGPLDGLGPPLPVERSGPARPSRADATRRRCRRARPTCPTASPARKPAPRVVASVTGDTSTGRWLASASGLDEGRVGAHAAVDPQRLDRERRCRPRPPRPGRRRAGRCPRARPARSRAGRCPRVRPSSVPRAP